MYLKEHITSSLVISALLFPFIKYNTFYFLIGAILIDVDHYVLYVFKKRDLSLKRAHAYLDGKRVNDTLHVFHVLEFWLISFVLAILFKPGIKSSLLTPVCLWNDFPFSLT